MTTVGSRRYRFTYEPRGSSLDMASANFRAGQVPLWGEPPAKADASK
jgi:hypothetical protein